MLEYQLRTLFAFSGRYSSDNNPRNDRPFESSHVRGEEINLRMAMRELGPFLGMINHEPGMV